MWYKILPLLFLMACASSKETKISVENNTEPNPRLHDIWGLKLMAGEKIPEDLNKAPMLEIFVQDKKAMGNDGCNSFNGSIKKLTATEIEFGMMMGTKMACPNLEFSQNFNKNLSQSHFYKIEKMNLILMDESGKEILRFIKMD